jgi:hypothetical protein
MRLPGQPADVHSAYYCSAHPNVFCHFREYIMFKTCNRNDKKQGYIPYSFLVEGYSAPYNNQVP